MFVIEFGKEKNWMAKEGIVSGVAEALM